MTGLAELAGVTFTEYQEAAFAGMAAQPAPLRACLYFKTGAGKTLTSLVGVRQGGHSHALVVAPPSTHDTWASTARKIGLEVQCVSHAKFRMSDFKVSRHTPVIADEMHMFGGHNKKGFVKLDKLAEHLQAPLILCSATPNYNDAERVYCVKHILDPMGTRGGYLQFLYANCVTEQDPFSQTPKVNGFLYHPDAKAYLAALPGVYYLPDDLVYTIDDLDVPVVPDQVFEELGYDSRGHRIMASGIEKKHRRIFNQLVDEHGSLSKGVVDVIDSVRESSSTPVLVFSNHSTVANAYARTLYAAKVKHAVITGTTPAKKKLAYLDAFRDGVLDVLVGTASLATGTDGLDKVCDTLIILDDTEDDAQRRQLVGRIMPRGLDTDASRKQVKRIVLT